MTSILEDELDGSFKAGIESSKYIDGADVTVTELANFQSDVEEVQNIDGAGEMHEEDRGAPRADGRKDAWLFLAGCFLFEALIWGFPFAFGVFQSYYSTHAPFDHDPTGIAVIGTCATGIMYLFAPVSLYILERFPKIRRTSSIIGLILVLVALVGASFASHTWHLVITQGVLYAIGGSLLYSPTMFYLDEWFIKRKGLALGVMWSGVGTSGLIFPFLLSFLVDRYGYSSTLRIWAVVMFLLCFPLIYYIKPRLQPHTSKKPHARPSYIFLQSPTFWFLQTANTLTSLGFFSPSIYLPSYASSLHYSPTIGILLIALLNSFSVVGAIALGHLTDTWHISSVIMLSSILTTIPVLLLWGLSTSLPSLIIFTIMYGIFAGGWSAIWAGMIREVQRRDQNAGFGVLMGLFSAGRGVGSVVCGPVSEILVSYGGWHSAVGGYGTEYGLVIVFTGISSICGLIGVATRLWKTSR